MSTRLEKYLQRHAAILTQWPITGGVPGERDAIIVIPALAEYPGIADTLNDLARCPGAGRVTVLVVVNHREDAPEDNARNSHATVAHLAARSDPYALCWTEAVLPRKDGVGLARKIGMDHALALAAPYTAIVCLDADTRVDDDYVERLFACFAAPRWGVVFDYAHPLDGAHRDAIVEYECFLRYCELGLRHAGSPYAYTAMGSAMACTAEAYATSGGMRRKQAGEDFYFLQAVAKCGRVERYPDLVVRPAARISDRVPFGTGRSLGDFTQPGARGFYHPAVYDVLRNWLQLEDPSIEAAPKALRLFLQSEGFDAQWPTIAAQNPDPAKRRAQFHRWFDAFRTLKAIHHLRDHGYPNQPMPQAIADLTGLDGMDEEPIRLLLNLRQLSSGGD